MKISLRRPHAPMVRNGAFSYKIDYITIILEILNPEGHQNCINGSSVTAILLNECIFPIGKSGEASRWRVCYQRGLPRLVCIRIDRHKRTQPAKGTAEGIFFCIFLLTINFC